MHIQHINIKNVKPYSNNAKLHPQEQRDQIPVAKLPAVITGLKLVKWKKY